MKKDKLSVEVKEKRRMYIIINIIEHSNWLTHNAWPVGPLKVVQYKNSIRALEPDNDYIEQHKYAMSAEFIKACETFNMIGSENKYAIAQLVERPQSIAGDAADL